MCEPAYVRRMERADLEDVVTIHLAAFPTFFLSSLGASFLRMYYECVLADRTSITLVAHEKRRSRDLWLAC